MNAQQRFLLGVFTTAIAVALVLCCAGKRGTAYAAERHPTDRPATHNMLVVGEETVYLSHLPMFQAEGAPPMPHRYQAILEVTLEKQGDYAKDRREHRTTNIYTLNPEIFVLPELVASDPQRKPRDSFKAKAVFRGHLERDDRVPILQDVEVRVKRVIHFREFDPKVTKSPQLEYLPLRPRSGTLLGARDHSTAGLRSDPGCEDHRPCIHTRRTGQGSTGGLPRDHKRRCLKAQREAAGCGGANLRQCASTEDDSG
jgi:hypothetical protein